MGAPPSAAPANCRILLVQRGKTNTFIVGTGSLLFGGPSAGQDCSFLGSNRGNPPGRLSTPGTGRGGEKANPGCLRPIPKPGLAGGVMLVRHAKVNVGAAGGAKSLILHDKVPNDAPFACPGAGPPISSWTQAPSGEALPRGH